MARKKSEAQHQNPNLIPMIDIMFLLLLFFKLGGYLKKEADASRGLDPKNPQVSELKVQIRADLSAPYGLAQRAMNTCAKAGIYKVEVGVARPMGEDKKKH